MFNTIFYEPLYNALVFLAGVIPGHDIGVAIILLTIIVKLILLPSYHKMLVTQKKIKQVEPEIKLINEKHKDNPQEKAKLTMEVYRRENINPFSQFIILFVQIPIVLALFWVFRSGFNFDPKLLYSFVHIPSFVSPLFLGIIDITSKSFPLAIVVGLTQFLQSYYALPQSGPRKEDASFAEDFGRSLNMQMKYVMPVIIVLISSNLPVALSLYWITGNIFSIGQELFVRRRIA
ncbi:MAG: YidC/Oxa1 family membrane protein insertase [bacterium]